MMIPGKLYRLREPGWVVFYVGGTEGGLNGTFARAYNTDLIFVIADWSISTTHIYSACIPRLGIGTLFVHKTRPCDRLT